jgi:hypothetical protein
VLRIALGAQFAFWGLIFAVPLFFRGWVRASRWLQRHASQRARTSMPEDVAARIEVAIEKRQAVTVEPPQSVVTVIGVLMIVTGIVGALGVVDIGTLISAVFAALSVVICWWSMRARASHGERRVAVLHPRKLPGWINPLILAMPLLQVPVVAATGGQGAAIDSGIVIASIVVATSTAYIYGKYADRALFGADPSAESMVDDGTRGVMALGLTFLGFVGPVVYVIDRSLALSPQHGIMWFEVVAIWAFALFTVGTVWKRRQAVLRLGLDKCPGDVVA